MESDHWGGLLWSSDQLSEGSWNRRSRRTHIERVHGWINGPTLDLSGHFYFNTLANLGF